ncbi:DUF397 domain-containing protein [Dactylosporangium sp. CS-047395]|uniref:DUF397 domain-containing protein n=1 Tax=Dactylosporangium sp. CS-047395 TaxID=3239936 RepID=UPI003D8E66B2
MIENPASHSPELAWRKARRSSGNGQCVEVATPGAVQVRDSKDPDGPVLTFAAADWTAFISDVQQGRYGLNA